MKRQPFATVTLAIAVSILTGCVFRPPLNAPETCARSGLALEAQSSTAAGGAVGSVTGLFAAEHRRCRPPETTRQRCEVRAYSASADIKAGFSTTGKNVAIGVGYTIFFVPGVVLYLVFNSSRSGVEKEATEALRKHLSECDRLAGR